MTNSNPVGSESARARWKQEAAMEVHNEASTLLNIEDVATRLGVTPRFVRRLVADRRIAFFKVGHFIRFDPADVEAWLQEQRHAPAA